MKGRSQLILLSVGIAGALILLLAVEMLPDLFANTTYLAGFLAVQIALFAIAHFESVFFPMLMGTFLWAGSMLPFDGTASSVRWFFLAAGALAGFIVWIKTPRAHHFSAVHLVALLCVVCALVSALISETPKIALLKVVSLFLLFAYAASGARAAVVGREERFLKGLVLACEVLVYISSACYFVLEYHIFGNPNALGAIISVVAVPVLLWAAVVADNRGLRQRRFFSLALCGGLLYSANSRASFFSALVVVVLLTVSLRRQRMLLQFAFVCVFFLTAMAVLNPSHMEELASSAAGRVVYKQGRTHDGLFGSRLSPWADTMAVVKRHPWFGSGFGTSELGQMRPDRNVSTVYTTEGSNREHGDSYLAMAEYLGLVGSFPFVILILMLVRKLFLVFGWIRRTGNPYNASIPFALVVSSGLIHACFEDWLFAMGSYLCVFFWVAAFVMMDLAPAFKAEAGAPSARSVPRFASSQVLQQPMA